LLNRGTTVYIVGSVIGGPFGGVYHVGRLRNKCCSVNGREFVENCYAACVVVQSLYSSEL